MMIKKNKVISATPFVLAFLFLFNPNIIVIDLLPDCVGYLLLCKALSKVIDLNDDLYGAHRAFQRMIFIDAGKIVAFLWIFVITVPTDRSASMLLWTFVFSALELIFLIPAYAKLFNGFINLAYLFPNKKVLGTGRGIGKIGVVKIITIIFVILKSVLCVLPEFADLTNTAYDETANIGMLNLYNYIGIMRVFAFIPALLSGILWLFIISNYFIGICREKEFNVALTEKYNSDILPRKGLFIRRNFHTYTIVTIVALIFTLDFRVDNQNIIPDVLAAVVFLFSFILLEKYIDNKNRIWILFVGVFFCFSVLSFICEYHFFANYHYGAIIRNEAALNSYRLIVIATVLKSIFFLLITYSMLVMINRSIKNHTGFVYGREHNDEGEKKLINSVHKDLGINLLYVAVFAVLYAISDICYDLLTPEYGFMGFINFVFGAIFIIIFIRALFAIQSAINTKYMLE